MRLAVDELNKKGGFAGKYKIKLVIKDNKTDPALSAQIAQELISAKANAVVTACDADLTIAAAQLLQRAKIPSITSCASTPTIPQSVGNYMFLNFVGDNAEAAALADYAVKKGYKRAWTLASSDSLYTTKLPGYFKTAFEKRGGRVVGSDQFKLSGGDFSAQVTKIKNANPKPDVIYTPMYPPDTPTLLKQLRAAGVKTPVVGNDGNDNPVIATASGSAANGFVFATVAYAQPGSPLAALGVKYKKKFGKSPEALSFTGVAYDLVYVLNAAVKKAGSIDGPKVRDALDNLVGFKGVTGTYTYKGHGRVPSRPVYLVRVNNGKFTLLSKSTPKNVPKP
jgi:branched-chain amino acid transport system substrate-binding protein